MVEISIKCIHYNSSNIVKMDKQMENHDANAKRAAKPSKPNTKTTEPNPKPNNKY